MDINDALVVSTYTILAFLVLVLLTIEFLVRPSWRQNVVNLQRNLFAHIGRKNSSDNTSGIDEKRTTSKEAGATKARQDFTPKESLPSIEEANEAEPTTLDKRESESQKQTSSTVNIQDETSKSKPPSTIEVSAEVNSIPDDIGRAPSPPINTNASRFGVVLRTQKKDATGTADVRHSIFAGDLHVTPSSPKKTAPSKATPKQRPKSRLIRRSLTDLSTFDEDATNGRSFLNRFMPVARDKANQVQQMQLVPPPPPIERIPSKMKQRQVDTYTEMKKEQTINPYKISNEDNDEKNGDTIPGSSGLLFVGRSEGDGAAYLEMKPTSPIIASKCKGRKSSN